MRINIAASHRFHLLDLARELEYQGHDVCFYSYVPTTRAMMYGLKKKNSVSLFYLMIPFLVLVKLSKSRSWSIKIKNLILDYWLSWFMRPCDVYIGLGTVYEKSFTVAKKKFKAITILEWGSKHIVEENKAIGNSIDLNDYFVNRSITGYNSVDYISIPSKHVKESFQKHGFCSNKLLMNPYGVDFSVFKPTEISATDVYDVIMVGGWSFRKGCDLICDVFKNSTLKFLHVGPVVDLPFPKEENMRHYEPVEQKKLIDFYKMAKIFLLPSRTEGLAMVQVQAMACGLPIVCSKDTGGNELQNFLTDKRWIIEFDKADPNKIRCSINEAIQLADTQIGLRNYVGDDIINLTWKAYGERYNHIINKIFNEI